VPAGLAVLAQLVLHTSTGTPAIAALMTGIARSLRLTSRQGTSHRRRTDEHVDADGPGPRPAVPEPSHVTPRLALPRHAPPSLAVRAYLPRRPSSDYQL